MGRSGTLGGLKMWKRSESGGRDGVSDERKVGVEEWRNGGMRVEEWYTHSSLCRCWRAG